MAVNLNLLPQDLTVGKDLGNAVKVLRAVNVIALALFIAFALGVSGFFVVSTFQLQSLNSSKDQLSSQIKSLQTTEQKLVLLKDRVSKIKLTSTADSAQKSLGLVSPLLNALPASSSVSELNLDTTKLTISILFKSSADVSNFFQALYASTSFKSITLTSFGFNPTSGYLVSLSLTGK